MEFSDVGLYAAPARSFLRAAWPLAVLAEPIWPAINADRLREPALCAGGERGCGIILGVTFSWGITMVTGWQAPVSAFAITGGFLFPAAAGIFFGYYQARKAARLDAIEALRYE